MHLATTDWPDLGTEARKSLELELFWNVLLFRIFFSSGNSIDESCWLRCSVPFVTSYIVVDNSDNTIREFPSEEASLKRFNVV